MGCIPFQTPQLPPVEVQNLRVVCGELEIPESSFEWLLSIALQIMVSEAIGRDTSVPQRKRELKNVAALAQQLNDALQGLEPLDRLAIHQGFRGLQIRMTLDPPDPMREALRGEDGWRAHLLCENVLLLGDVLLTLESIAQKAEAALIGPMKGGRPRDVLARAYHLTEVARFAYKHGIPVDRGRRFVRLSEAVFFAAGIDVSPEPAIRFFVAELLPTYAKEWANEGDKQGKGSG